MKPGFYLVLIERPPAVKIARLHYVHVMWRISAEVLFVRTEGLTVCSEEKLLWVNRKVKSVNLEELFSEVPAVNLSHTWSHSNDRDSNWGHHLHLQQGAVINNILVIAFLFLLSIRWPYACDWPKAGCTGAVFSWLKICIKFKLSANDIPSECSINDPPAH